MKAAQTVGNEKNPTSQAKSLIRDKIIPEIIIDKNYGVTKEMINTKAEITNKEAKYSKETEGGTMVVPEGYIFNRRQSSKMDTVCHMDGGENTKSPNVSDVLKAMP